MHINRKNVKINYGSGKMRNGRNIERHADVSCFIVVIRWVVYQDGARNY